MLLEKFIAGLSNEAREDLAAIIHHEEAAYNPNSPYAQLLHMVADYLTPDIALRKLNQEELKLIFMGHTIDAIKSVKDRLGIGLKEAKELVRVAMEGK